MTQIWLSALWLILPLHQHIPVLFHIKINMNYKKSNYYNSTKEIRNIKIDPKLKCHQLQYDTNLAFSFVIDTSFPSITSLYSPILRSTWISLPEDWKKKKSGLVTRAQIKKDKNEKLPTIHRWMNTP